MHKKDSIFAVSCKELKTFKTTYLAPSSHFEVKIVIYLNICGILHNKGSFIYNKHKVKLKNLLKL